ncbi:hypothetical protein DDB_G0275657 [Dictyostelium discoideum AX4]|uniref:Putative uncharacterized protein DDB_G0275657 n=1 Tax=Dictyostelium discoideum TaxID=44689 RepID=Y7239_DICDI|nr:hypothetical protein DDB_G0275657 [Dictyostelium discoideum AX4]Q86H39.1 RecName: Full=Putative uncharacterized protein DDB_G0275657 [Dictyostelium discoideum]EAL69579.1 hypothetical protein DDB_G0275657 [Dictyostelium discoideum AX4]|eukprot:XP_643523.1 hypothetical protein DDB_G0275657 [Dictyostelium discoideum AX4]
MNTATETVQLTKFTQVLCSSGSLGIRIRKRNDKEITNYISEIDLKHFKKKFLNS